MAQPVHPPPPAPALLGKVLLSAIFFVHLHQDFPRFLIIQKRLLFHLIGRKESLKKR
jgi:hypothetical protein